MTPSSLALAAFYHAAVALSATAAAAPAAPAGWPIVDWSTVPTYTFCGPGKRHFNPAELDFISGKSGVGYAPRWMALVRFNVYFRSILGSLSAVFHSSSDFIE